MRYKPGHKEKTHKKIIETSSAAFRRGGYAATGVKELAEAANVTTGAFYSHFESKAVAFDAALACGLDEVIANIPKFQAEKGQSWLRHFAQYYMSQAHRDDMGGGCAMTSLTPEVVRSGPNTKALFEKQMNEIVSLMMEGLAEGSAKQRRARAWTTLGVLTGGLHLCRAMANSSTAEEIARSITKTAEQVAGPTRS